MTASGRRSLAAALAVVAALFLVSPAVAAPAPSPKPPAEEDTPLLGEVLQVTGKQYLQAKAALEKSRKDQLRLALELEQAEARVEALRPQVATVAAESYRSGRLTPAVALLNSASPDAFLERAVALEQWNEVNAQRLRELDVATERAAAAKAAMDAEVAAAAQAQAVMAKQKREAEKALDLVGGMKLTGGLVDATSPVAKAAPRGPDGQWPDESCSLDDPTTGGCITPRTMHAYKEVKKAGFDRFVGCYRAGGPYEHPKGRACDWSLRKSGFSPAANDDQKMYGNNLAAFLIRNADRLGVLYVIWYRQIWFPATGWKSYSGASDHTDHVHMSML
jgi:peptidoglycan DL-endopeptidase CwlO